LASLSCLLDCGCTVLLLDAVRLA